MKKIFYAPWRDSYTNKQIEAPCVFCYIAQHPDEDTLQQVLYRENNCFLVMNKYPYNPGHLMVIPYDHKDTLETLNPSIWKEMTMLAQQGVRMLNEILHAEGVNIGMNLGAVAGAGIAEHIHLHLVPRWQDDTDFCYNIQNSKLQKEDFNTIYEKLKTNISKYTNNLQ